MNNTISTEQLVYGVILAIIFALVIPILQKRTGKSMTEIFLGIRKKAPEKSAAADAAAPAKEPLLRNDRQSDLTVFISQLLKAARKNGMQLVAPGSVEYDGKTARLLALLVHPSGVTGIYCLGFGGTITPSSKPGQPWKQHMNGQDHTFENPLTVCNEQYHLIRAAMDSVGLDADLNVVTVFTSAHATLVHTPGRVFSRKDFLSYLSDTESLKHGSVDIPKVSAALAELAHVKDKKNGQKKQ